MLVHLESRCACCQVLPIVSPEVTDMFQIQATTTTSAMDSTGTRLRRAVKYPTEDDDNTSTGLDEQQQEEVINSISQDDAETIATYRVSIALRRFLQSLD